MYSVYGGAGRRRSWPKYTVAAVVMVMTGVIIGTLHSSFARPQTVKAATRHAALPAPKPVALETPTVAPAPAVDADVPTQVTDALQSAIKREPNGAWSVSVYDINGKRWLAQINADQQMTSASLYKLYAVYALSKVIDPADWPNKSVGDQSIASCVDRMLRLSDNTCGEAVSSMIGWGAIDRYAHAYGFSKTFTNLKTGPVTTANDTTQFMSDLYQSKLFDVSTTSSILDSLHHQAYRKGIPAGCSDCTVYNKTGNDATVNHDSAVVVSGGTTYAVTIMSQNGSQAGIARIERALQAVLQK